MQRSRSTFLLVMEWWQRDKKYALELGERAALVDLALRAPWCFAVTFVLPLYTGASLDFIYFPVLRERPSLATTPDMTTVEMTRSFCVDAASFRSF